MKSFLDKLNTYDYKELDKVSNDIISVSGSMSNLDKKFNKNDNSYTILMRQYWYRLKRISQDLDYIFLEDM